MHGDLRVGTWLVQPGLNTISQNGTSRQLEPKVMEVLVCLAQHPGETLAKEQLLKSVWPDTFVSDDVLVRSISAIRRAFEDDARESRFIQTIAKRGYRLVAPVQPVNGYWGLAPQVSKASAAKDPVFARRGLRLGITIGITATVALLILLALAPTNRWRTVAGKGDIPRIRSIAVLPLQNLSGDPGQEYFAEGLTDQLITDLARIAGLRVISRTSIMGYTRTSKRTPAIARELGVDGIVEGTVERDHGRVRIRVQLINAHTDEHFWAASYDSDGNDAFRLEADVASDVAHQIGHRLTEKGSESPTQGIPAPVYEEYLKARYYWNKRTPEGLTKAITQFERVIRQAPRFAPAYSGLADCYNVLTVYEDAMPAETFSKAKAAAMKALELDERLGDAHASLGEIYFRFDWDWEAAETEFRRAIELEPGYSTAHHWYAEYLVAMGRYDEGIAETEKALELDPLSLIINADAGWFFDMAGKHDRALLQLRRTMELEPRFSPTHLYLGEAYLRKKMYPEAIAAYRDSASLGDSSYSAPLGYAFGRVGKRAEARKIIEQLHRRPNMSPTSIAIVYAGLGDKDRAFALLERAFKDHDDSLIYIRSQTFFDPLRSEPRFQALLRRMAFPPERGS